MKLESIDIENFRSIKKETINLELSGKILVGINESGKSNLLRALSLLSLTINPTKEDIRESLPKEADVTESFVDFIFELDVEEIATVFENIFNSEIFCNDIEKKMLKNSQDEFSFKEFCELRRKAIYHVDTFTINKSINFFILDKHFKVLPNWKKHKAYNKVAGQPNGITNCHIVNTDELPEEEKANFVDITAEEINTLIENEIKKIIPQKLPNVVLWEYKKENDLPSSIEIDAFKVNPDSCVPLKNMFFLAGISDINKSITEARAGSPNKFRNLLEKVAEQTTDYIREIWQDYKSIDITLDPNGNNIDISVKEKNKFSFYQRSDGFKRFVTFILMISAVVKNKYLSNFILLIDEPEIHLHPTGIRYLRNELIKISQDNNYVVVSTHSIFMVDSERIKRHYIVKKVNEKTNILIPDEGNLSEEEVIFNAWGFSLNDFLNKKNIIFEGWRDKQLFKIAIENLPHGYKAVKDKFKDVGICHANGVSQIKNITPILELGKRECIILSDNDEPAKRYQTDYKRLYDYGIWKRYEEVDNVISAITGEDFIKDSAVNSAIDSVKAKHFKITSLENPSLTHNKGKLFAIDHWLKQAGYIDNEERKKIMNEIKDGVFVPLKVGDIEPIYFDYLKAVGNLI